MVTEQKRVISDEKRETNKIAIFYDDLENKEISFTVERLKSF